MRRSCWLPGCWAGRSCDQSGDECTEQGFAAATCVVHDLEEAEIERQLVLRETAVRPQPGAQQRPEAFERVDVHISEPVAVLVACILTPGMADHFVLIAPGWQAGVDTILVGVDERAFGNGGLDDRLDRGLLHVGQHVQDHLATALVQAHEVEAQHPYPQRLMVPGQRRAGEVVEAPGARLTSIALPVRLRVVAPIADHRLTATPGTAHALRPAMLANQREAFGVVHQPREVDQVGCRHDRQGSSHEGGRRSAAPVITSEAPRDRYPLPCLSTPRKPRRATPVIMIPGIYLVCPPGHHYQGTTGQLADPAYKIDATRLRLLCWQAANCPWPFGA